MITQETANNQTTTSMHDVHLYAIVRVKVCNVEAESMEQAIDVAYGKVEGQLHELLQVEGPQRAEGSCAIAHAEYAEEVPYAMVDLVGDDQYEQSMAFHADGDNWLPGFDPRVLITVSGGVADWVCDKGVVVEKFDFDDYRDDDTGTALPSEKFRDLAEPIEIPIATGMTEQASFNETREHHAETAFCSYNFGDDVEVVDSGRWEDVEGDDWIRRVHVEIDGESDSVLVSFHAKFRPGECVLSDAYALLVSNGSDIGAACN